jgi:methylated-DNA-[protein]-cysteine S-methyltransferase
MNVTPELDSRFRAAALAEGIVDVRYDLVDSPVGELLIAQTERGLCRVAFESEGVDEQLAATFGARVLRTRLERVARELDEYFAGERTSFELRVDLRAAAFQTAVLEELARVPYGRVETYGGLAAKLGKPRAARAVGGALNRNPIPIVLPCHRVVGASGSLVGYAGGLERKQALLRLEGATL